MSQPYVGEIRMFGGNFAPVNWELCRGQLLPISEYETLFQLIGTTYGGDGQSTFALPDLQSRVPIHEGPNFVIGQSGGVESVTLTTQQLPAHSHVPVAGSSAASATSPAGVTWAPWGDKQYSSSTTYSNMNAAALASVGGSQPHENMPPFLVVNFIISLFGIFPSQT